MRLAEPGWLILLTLVPLPWLWARSRPRIAWPTLQGFAKGPRAAAGWPSQIPLILRAGAIACLVVTLARPQSIGGQTRIAGKGVSIVVALDHSGSMEAADFPVADEAKPITRLEAARRTFLKFVAGRPDDLIGLVVFANYPDTACPPTLDHRALIEAAKAVRKARAGEDNTNLGDAVAYALGALRATSPTRKVLILLTDGRNSPAVPEPLDPEAAATLCRELGVTLHTIALGRPGGIVRRPDEATGLPIVGEADGPNVELLKAMADRGGGRAFAAVDAEALDQVFGELDALEKSPVQGTIRTRYHEEFRPWALAAAALLALDILLSSTRLRRLP